MANSVVFLGILTITLIYLANPAEGIWCYKCHSKRPGEEWCKDRMSRSSTRGLVNCDTQPGGGSTCWKVSTIGRRMIKENHARAQLIANITSRGCGQYGTNADLGCEYHDGAHGPATSCYCEGDRCNTAQPWSSSSPVILLLSSAAAALLLRLLR